MLIRDSVLGARRGSLLARVFGRDDDVRAVDPEVVPSPSISGHVSSERSRAEDSGRPAVPEPRLYLEARGQIKRRAWGHAQRALEEMERKDPGGPAQPDLRSLRLIRRSLRRVARWPSDVDAHLDLGRAYFDLDLGGEALSEFLIAQRLAPRRYEGFALAALEFLYRGEYAAAVAAWSHAMELNSELAPLEEVLGAIPVG